MRWLSDHPAHVQSITRAFALHSCILQYPMILLADSECSDHTAQRSLIRAFAIRTWPEGTLSLGVVHIFYNRTFGKPLNKLPFLRRFLSCSSSFFVRRWFRVWRLFCHYLFLISPDFDASGRLCFLIVAFPGYLHLYLFISITKTHLFKYT